MNRRSKGSRVVVNPFNKEENFCRSLNSQNAAMNSNFCKPRTASAQFIKTNQNLHKEKGNLAQFLTKNVLFGDERLPQKKPCDKKLANIESTDRFLKLAIEQVDIATTQLAVIRKLLLEQLWLIAKAAEEEGIRFCKHQRVFKKNCTQEFEKLQKTDKYKTIIRLQSLQDHQKKEDKNVDTVRKSYPRDFLEQAIEQVDLATNQLAIIKTMLLEQLNSITKAAEEEEISFQKHQTVFKDKLGHQCEEMQKMYEYKTRIRLQSSQDNENKKDKSIETVDKTYFTGLISNATGLKPEFSRSDSYKKRSDKRKQKLKVIADFINSL